MNYMKILFFICLFIPSFAFSQTNDSLIDSKWFHFFQMIDSWQKQTKQTIIQAQNEKNVNLQNPTFVNFLFWDEKGISPLTGTKGSSSPVLTPFGKIQILTDSTGTLRKNKIYGVIDITINKNWSIFKPTFQIKEKNNIKNIHFFSPIIPPLKQNIHKPYVINASFPFYIELAKPSRPIHLDLNLSINACLNQNCTEYNYDIPFKLDASQEYSSPFKPYIASAWSFLPQKTSKNNVQFFITDNNTLWINIDKKQPITYNDFILFSNGNPVQIINEKIIQTNNKTLLILKTKPELKEKPIQLIYSGEKGIWKAKTNKPKLQEIPINNSSNNSLPWFSTALAFLFLSPLLTLLLFYQPDNEYEAKKEAQKRIFLFISTGIILSLYFSFFPALYGSLFNSPFWIAACTLIFFVMYLSHQKPSSLSYITLTMIAPLSFLAPLWNHFYSENLSFIICFYLTFITCLPYILFWLCPHFAVLFSHKCKLLSAYLIKLPLMACCLWYIFMGLSLFANQKMNIPAYDEQIIKEAIHQNKLVILSVGPDWCISCTLNRANLLYVGMSKKLIQNQQLFLMKKNYLYKNYIYPQNVIFTTIFPNGKTVSSWIPDYKMQKFFNSYLDFQ